MDKVHIGIIGTGNMGQGHLGYMDRVAGAELAAICDTDPDVLKRMSEKYPQAKAYDDHRKLLADKVCDGVIICTPHYFHPPIAKDCFLAGVHVLCEKPLGVHTKHVKEIIDFHKREASHLRFAVMFMSRTYPVWQKAKEIITSEQLGELRRVSWIITGWFRSQAYYDSGGWRATWGGEGGGVLLNQCPHNLDLLTWLTGLPKRVTANVELGKYHGIEVEDFVNAMFEYENGASGQFITTTGEAPGSNHLEIVGDCASMFVRGNDITLIRTSGSVQEYLNTTKDPFRGPNCTTENVEIGPFRGFGHQEITENFVNSILNGEEIIVKAEDGIAGLALGNAMLMSGLKKKPVDLPFDDNEYAAMIADLASKSSFQKVVRKAAEVDMKDSFH